tara:strand:- start:6031 stop:7422 length:1392 start_codon:yes stop_codon:yes gene_type:complete
VICFYQTKVIENKDLLLTEFYKNNYIDNKMHRKILFIAVPLILSNLTVPLLTFVDTAMIGHLGNVSYLGGITAGATLFTLIYGNFIFLRMGTTGLSAQAFGARENNELSNVFSRSIFLGLLIGLLIIVFRDAIFTLFMPVLSLSGNVGESSANYMSIRIFSAPAVLMNFGIIGCLIGIQKTKVVLIITFLVNGLNVILDYVFVVFYKMDVSGVALGTLISEWVACIFGLIVFAMIFKRFNMRLFDIKLFSKEEFLKLFNLNFDIFIRTFCLVATHIWLINRSSNLGDLVLAANGILLNFVYISAFFVDGFAFTTESLVGEAKGAKDGTMFKRYVINSTIWCVVSGMFCVIFFGVFGAKLIALLTDIVAVKEVSNEYLLWVILLPVISAFSYQLDGIFTGVTRTRDMRNGAIISFFVFIISTIIFIPIFANHGLWLAYILFILVRAITLALRFPALQREIILFK